MWDINRQDKKEEQLVSFWVLGLLFSEGFCLLFCVMFVCALEGVLLKNKKRASAPDQHEKQYSELGEKTKRLSTRHFGCFWYFFFVEREIIKLE